MSLTYVSSYLTSSVLFLFWSMNAWTFNFMLKGLSTAVRNIITGGSKLAVDFSCVCNDCLSVHGLLGVDVLKYKEAMQLIHFMKGSAFEFLQGIVPFGNVSDFLCPVVNATNSDVSNISYSQAIADYSQCPVTHVYFVLDQKSDYFDPFDNFTESSVERAVDKLFSFETLGIVVNDYDRDKITSFCNSISYRDDYCHVNLPWDEDKLPYVPSSHPVALIVIDRVVTRLTKQGLERYTILKFFYFWSAWVMYISDD